MIRRIGKEFLGIGLVPCDGDIMRRAVRASLLAAALLSPAAAANAKPYFKTPTYSSSQHCEVSASAWWQLRGGSKPCPPPAPAAFSLQNVRGWHPVLLALLGTSFGWFMTALGCVLT